MDTKKKRTKSSSRRNSTSDSDSSGKIFPVLKRKRIDIFDTTSSEDTTPSNVAGSSKQDNCGTESKSSITTKSQPIDYFNLFVDSFLLTSIVRETNKFAMKLIKAYEIDQGFELKPWKPVTLPEMKAFIAVLLEMGITRRKTFFSYWSKNSRNIPWFSKMFSQDRFQHIYRCFHLADNKKCPPPGHKKYEPCLNLIPIIEYVNKICKLISGYGPNNDAIVIKKRNRNEKSKTKLCISDDYSIHIKGIDKVDKILYVYLDKRRRVKNWKTIAFHIISYMVLNSYLYYRQINKKKLMTHLNFISAIIFGIENEWMKVKKKHIAIDNDTTFDLMKLQGGNLKQCAVCNTKIYSIKRQNLVCVQCKKGLHPLCFHKHACFKSNECRKPAKR